MAGLHFHGRPRRGERDDVNLNQEDTAYGRAPLSLAAEGGHEGVIKMLLERKDVRTATAYKEGRTPQSLALSNGHDGVVKIILGWGSANSYPDDRGGQAPPEPPTGNVDERVVGLEFGRNDSSADPSDLDGLPAIPSVDYSRREVVLGPKDSASMSADSDFSTETSGHSEPPSICPLKPPHPLPGIITHPDTTQPILLFPVNRHFIIPSLICIFALLLCILPSSSPDIFSFHKWLAGEGFV